MPIIENITTLVILQISSVYHNTFQIVNYNDKYTKSQPIENVGLRACIEFLELP